jgi:hypothetical protein
VKKTFSLLLLLFCFSAHSQDVYQHVSNSDLYDFIDELSNLQVIEMNTAIKPYSRMLIATKLSEANSKREQLNSRQQKELDFYLQDYNKELMPDKNFKKRYDLFYYKDTLFTISVNPILGLDYYKNDSGGFYHRWNGGEFFSYVGKNFGFYASLRDNHESKRFTNPMADGTDSAGYLNLFPGSNYKPDTKGGGDFDEVRGGLSYSWKWGSAGIVKDNFVWGDNYHGANIFSGRQPSFTALKFSMTPVRWLNFNYYHGWLVSDVLDSARSYSAGPFVRIGMHPKWVAANMFTFMPLRGLNLSVGNSIIYSDQSINIAYLVPFFFYKTVDHGLSSAGSNWLGQNSQMYFNISSRNVKNVHLYMSAFIDEIALGRATDSKTQTNFISLKLGGRVSNILNKNVTATIEYTRTNPGAYRHYIPTATFSSNSFNLGHYLGDNAEEIYLALSVRPIAKLFLEASMTNARKGTYYTITGSSRDTLNNGKGLPFMKTVRWENATLAFNARYQIVNDAWIFFGITSSEITGDTKYTMPNFRGKLTTINLGANFGF